jgi:predicted RND superfamily exporter protein
MFRWGIGIVISVLTVCAFVSQPILAQTEDDKKDPPSEGFHDTMRRMAIKRAEDEHKKLVKSSQQAAEIAGRLSQDIQGEKRDSLGRGAEKKLREIEKAAKQIRNNVGSNNDDKDFETPKNVEEAVTRLTETSKQLSEQMEKTSRHITSAAIIISASDMLRLIKFLRGYIQ